MFYAHRRDDGTLQTVTEHLIGTSRLCKNFASAFGEGERGALLGMAHDIGKNSDAFQKRLFGGAKVDHATAGAVECKKIGEFPIGGCVIGHHGGLPDFGSISDPVGTPTYCGRLKKEIPPYVWDGTLQKGIPMPKLPDPFACSMWLRMLYSCLVDADYLDTEAFMQESRRPKYDTLATLSERLDACIAPWFPPKTELNAHRCRILRQCMEKADAPRGLFSLTVPTGGGKTVASLAFALKHAVAHGLERIIYVIPYTSIIEQNAQVFRKILGDENVIEHHSNLHFDEEHSTETDRRHLACENWDAPIVVTTAVQFFESLYSNRPSQCRKLHNIANSVVIFDEAQMLPTCHLKPCVGAIANLAAHFRTTAVLCTATQPVLDDLMRDFCPNLSITELCPQVDTVFREFRRVTYRDGGTLGTSELAEYLARQEQVLCIFNTRAMAQEVFSLLPPDGRFHLSTLMYPKHRTQILNTIRDRLAKGLTCRVVSTSLIEAGVDVDFPAVFRQMAGLDSLTQAGGRCNREGKRSADESIVTYFESERPSPALQRVNIGAAREALCGGTPLEEPATVRRYFSALRSLVGDNLDKYHAVANLKNGIAGCAFPFRTVAEKFHLIDSETMTVYIPTAENEAILRRIQEGTASRQDYRVAASYGVNIYARHFQALLSAGDIFAVTDDCGILTHAALYDAQMGLSLEADSGRAEFI